MKYLDPETELRMKELICQIVDNRLYQDLQTYIEDELAREMLRANKSDSRDDIASEYRVLTRFFNRLSTIANEVRVLQNQKQDQKVAE